jgi:hypothetical protein
MTYRPIIIGFTSDYPGAGKTTSGQLIREIFSGNHFLTIGFADPIKQLSHELLCRFGVKSTKALEHLYINKNEIIDGLNITGRELLQRFGTDFGRNMIHPDLWVSIGENYIDEIIGQGDCVVVDDVRRANEAEAILKRGGHIFRIVRHEAEARYTGNHESEGELRDWSFPEILNDGDESHLSAQLADRIAPLLKSVDSDSDSTNQ